VDGQTAAWINRGRSGVHAVALAITLTAMWGCATGVKPNPTINKANAEVGKIRYEQYCTPCHGPGGGPGTAKYRSTGEPVDLRTYVERNGGTFPAAQWIAVTQDVNPGGVHADVWNTIQKYNMSMSLSNDDSDAKGVLAMIANYIMSVQVPTKK